MLIKNNKFKLVSDFSPMGDQPQAIKKLEEGLSDGLRDQVLLGVTGSGKTFTMANVIADLNRPALIMAHNKTLAAQLYSEMKAFFPDNAVEYFVSYYDYYQPEAYIAKTDTFIEKDSSINEQIDRLRHSATRSLLERKDVIVVSSVSCIYGLGSAELYVEMTLDIQVGEEIGFNQITKKLIELQYERNDVGFVRGKFRVQGDVIDIFPAHQEDRAWRFSFFGDELEEIYEFDPLTGERMGNLEKVSIFPNSHHVTPKPTVLQAIEKIKPELRERIKFFEEHNALIEAQRIEQRTQFDIEMLLEAGTCRGIENYSRHLFGRKEGEPPPTLFEYLPKDSILFVDESHVTVSQIGGMYKGDRARKTNLVEHGFRLPSAKDNRPLKSEEWEEMRPQTIFVSATPAKYELEKTGGEIVEQVIRPTGLLDPVCEIRPIENQVDDVIAECNIRAAKDERVLVTTLTKKMAENLTEYLQDVGLKTAYLHSDVDTLERTEIIRDLRIGIYDVLVGINLLREGLDIPECTLVTILDADKAGFLRSETSLTQTIGRAARNSEGRVLLYADVETDAIKNAISETNRRRAIQEEYNKKHGITPTTVKKAVADSLQEKEFEDLSQSGIKANSSDLEISIDMLKKKMLNAAENLEFEEAARLRDLLKKKEDELLGI